MSYRALFVILNPFVRPYGLRVNSVKNPSLILRLSKHNLATPLVLSLSKHSSPGTRPA